MRHRLGSLTSLPPVRGLRNSWWAVFVGDALLNRVHGSVLRNALWPEDRGYEHDQWNTNRHYQSEHDPAVAHSAYRLELLVQATRPRGVMDQRAARGVAMIRPRDSNCPIARRALQLVSCASRVIWAAESKPPGTSTVSTAVSATVPVPIGSPRISVVGTHRRGRRHASGSLPAVPRSTRRWGLRDTLGGYRENGPDNTVYLCLLMAGQCPEDCCASCALSPVSDYGRWLGALASRRAISPW